MKRLNVNEWIWFAILLGFSYYIYDLIATEKISIFIHPKMMKYVYFSLFIFVLLSIFQIRQLFQKSNRTPVKLGYILFVIPLILGFGVNPQGISADVAAKKGVTINQGKGSISIQKDQPEISDFIQDGMVAFDDGNFAYILEDMMRDYYKYKGNKVVITGFVFREDDFDEKEFVVGRMMMTCCAADAQVVGLLSRWENTATLSNDQWVRVVGTLDVTNFYDKYLGQEHELTVIQVEQVELIEKPSIQYIYP
ncbi:TIGR03943 family putative permease subunit [Geosporobacter ferrireducens]|uniref:TIGR03943 family protein n=1 Tax=Geosporobacter ferrireducens TaxID=1424294 RepID=A0A1D8GH19_9FIRM|nr:TIGR03943 family protein [Geosporobacter ferrireducens]AOT70212.1 TIGR03943 family protein [Geosporobacter ferrireducens]MTI53239.1 TIGR03943 family protein [Geosporobacter ferrireducens]